MDTGQTLKVLFLHANYPRQETIALYKAMSRPMINPKNLEHLAEEVGHPIHISDLETNNHTVSEVTQKILNGEFDCVVLDALHAFYREDKHDSSAERLTAYEELGLLNEEEAWAAADDDLRINRKFLHWLPGQINEKLSATALCKHLKNAFDTCGSQVVIPKFGYMGSDYELENISKAYDKLEMKEASYFTLDNSKPDEENVKKILTACGREPTYE